jgi:NADP-dependent 3-hydroxy acid dehydrogenase YdfG
MPTKRCDPAPHSVACDARRSVALVTAGTDGIGKAIAEALVTRGV